MAVVVRPGEGEWAGAAAKTIAADVTALLLFEPRLRVVSDEIVAPYASSELTAEEIGRALNVQAVAGCTVDAGEGRLDAVVDLIDVLREAVVSHRKYLARMSELDALDAQIVRAIGEHCPVVDAFPTASAVPQARAARAAVAVLRRRAGLFFGDGDFESAERELRAAVDRDPGSPATHRQLGDLLLATGRRSEAARHHGLVADWLPLDESAQIAGTFAHYFGPQPLDAAGRLRELSSRFSGARDWLVRSLVAGGDVLRAREAVATRFAHSLVAAFVHEPFDPSAFRAYERALMFAAAGRADSAFASLEQAEASGEAMFAKVEPLLVPLRSDARFERFSRRFTPNLRA